MSLLDEVILSERVLGAGYEGQDAFVELHTTGARVESVAIDEAVLYETDTPQHFLRLTIWQTPATAAAYERIAQVQVRGETYQVVRKEQDRRILTLTVGRPQAQ